jgi:RNA polymerase sigma-70 factor (ECF subfamily)
VATDLQEAAQAAAGDARAFERLYRAHVARIHSLVRRMLASDEATEVTQDVFVRAWQKIGTFRGEAAFGTWLHRLAVNVVLTRRAELGTRRSRFIAEEQVLESLPARPASRDLALDFETAVARLPEGARHIFVLHDVEGYRHEEIAGLLGVTSGTTKAQLHRARMLLRRHLGDRG